MLPCQDAGGYRRYKYKLGNLLHAGHDFNSPRDSYVYAVRDGSVIFYSGDVQGYGGKDGDKQIKGYCLWIKHRGKDGKWYVVQYGHCKSFFKVGDIVDAKDPIGVITDYKLDGNSVPHLHFGVYEGEDLPKGKWGYVESLENWTDPIKWLNCNT